MVDFVRNGVTLSPSPLELQWRGGRGSFVVEGTSFTSAQLLAEFDPTVGAQFVDSALTVSATGVVNFELPTNCLLSVVLVPGAGSIDFVAALPIVEKGKT